MKQIDWSILLLTRLWIKLQNFSLVRGHDLWTSLCPFCKRWEPNIFPYDPTWVTQLAFIIWPLLFLCFISYLYFHRILRLFPALIVPSRTALFRQFLKIMFLNKTARALPYGYDCVQFPSSPFAYTVIMRGKPGIYSLQLVLFPLC